MKYYVLQVVTGTEQLIKEMLSQLEIINPQRKMIIRRKGKEITEVKTLFPGYLFLKTDDLDIQLLKDTKHIIKILNDYTTPVPLSREDIDTLLPILKPGIKPEISNIKYDEDERIVVINGPLKDFEGKIIKVDKRKKRATVQIEMYNKFHKINFSFIDISK